MLNFAAPAVGGCSFGEVVCLQLLSKLVAKVLKSLLVLRLILETDPDIFELQLKKLSNKKKEVKDEKEDGKVSGANASAGQEAEAEEDDDTEEGAVPETATEVEMAEDDGAGVPEEPETTAEVPAESKAGKKGQARGGEHRKQGEKSKGEKSQKKKVELRPAGEGKGKQGKKAKTKSK